jgi:hypothetical protein
LREPGSSADSSIGPSGDCGRRCVGPHALEQDGEADQRHWTAPVEQRLPAVAPSRARRRTRWSGPHRARSTAPGESSAPGSNRSISAAISQRPTPGAPAGGVHIAGPDLVRPRPEIVLVRRPAGDPADQILPVDGDQLDVVLARFGQRLVAQPRQPVVSRQIRVADQPPEPGAPARRVEGGNPIASPTTAARTSTGGSCRWDGRISRPSSLNSSPSVA